MVRDEKLPFAVMAGWLLRPGAVQGASRRAAIALPWTAQDRPQRIVNREEKERQLKRDALQIRNHLEVTFVVRGNGVTEVERRDSDQRSENGMTVLAFRASASILPASCPISFVNG